MGDHRVTLTIIVEMHGKKKKIDGAWINWSDRIGEEYGEWIQDQCDEMRAEAVAEWALSDFEKDQKEEKERELAELKRLQAKYPEEPQQ
jgi:hypothetical protein